MMRPYIVLGVQALISIAIVGVFVFLAVKMPEVFKDPLVTAVAGILGYWIGSSQGSKDKQEAMRK